MTFSFKAEVVKFQTVQCTSLKAQVNDSTNTIWHSCTARQILWYKVVYRSFSEIYFPVSSEEVKLFKQLVVSANSTEEEHMTNFVQWIENNVNHILRTSTGKGTIHGMGIITVTISKLRYDAIKRLKHNKEDLSATSFKITP